MTILDVLPALPGADRPRRPPQPSVTKMGGASQFGAISATAKAWGRTLMSHSPYLVPGYWVTLHLAATLPERALIEHTYVAPEAAPGLSPPWPEDGALRLPDGPRIGLAPDLAVLQRDRVL